MNTPGAAPKVLSQLVGPTGWIDVRQQTPTPASKNKARTKMQPCNNPSVSVSASHINNVAGVGFGIGGIIPFFHLPDVFQNEGCLFS